MTINTASTTRAWRYAISMDGIGSIYDYMEAFEEAVDGTTDAVSIRDAASFELVTLQDVSHTSRGAEEEIAQYLSIGVDGQIQFHTNTYHLGPGHYGIGRVMHLQISPATVCEITRMLDTWLYMKGEENWSPAENTGKWYLRIRSVDDKERVYRGALEGAFLDGIDISWFLRERIPVPELYLFDQS